MKLTFDNWQFIFLHFPIRRSDINGEIRLISKFKMLTNEETWKTKEALSKKTKKDIFGEKRNLDTT